MAINKKPVPKKPVPKKPLRRNAAADSEQEYFKNVEVMAQDIIDEVKDEDNIDKAREKAYDRLHEDVDGSYWVIYSHAARKTLEYSKNEDAIFDQGMDLNGIKSVNEFNTQAAYWALYQDVMDELDGKLDELEEEMAAREEEDDSEE